MATKCPKCDFENLETQKICGECGTQLTPSDSIPDVTKTIETPAQELTRDTVFANRYKILEKLSKGGMGEVYRVKDTKLDVEMALKVSRPEITSYKGIIVRFKNEPKLLEEALAQGVEYQFGPRLRYYIHPNMSLEPLCDYPPFQELIKPKG